MEVISYLFFTHFLADYPFQPGALVAYKKRSFLGVLLHSTVHLLFATLILFPFWSLWQVWLSVGIIFGTHVCIDQTKVWLEKNSPRKTHFTIYLLDQFTHLAVITLVSLTLMRDLLIPSAGSFMAFFSDRTVIHFFLVLVLATYVYDITSWTYRNVKNPHPYKRNYSLMARNALIIVIAFVLYWISR
ncbi:DUF3307 domain-containing protein [Candidatus Peregrinibacteria bacterium]|nr:DUF3307 domain-containing protein [Candidatus Peregrinibacteria bacterium]